MAKLSANDWAEGYLRAEVRRRISTIDAQKEELRELASSTGALPGEVDVGIRYTARIGIHAVLR